MGEPVKWSIVIEGEKWSSKMLTWGHRLNSMYFVFVRD
jgi:hypothetical protein